MRFIRVLLFCAIVASAGAAPSDVTGNWRGTLAIDKVKLRLVFRIMKTADDRLIAKMDSVDQGARDLPVDSVSFKDPDLKLGLEFIKGGYEGKLAGNNIEGTWNQAGKSYPLTLTKFTPRDGDDEEHLSAIELASSKELAQKLGGPWAGTISAEGISIPITLNIKTNKIGAAAVSLDSPDLGLKGIPLQSLSYKAGKFHFEAQGLGALYDGVMLSNNSSITGQWHQAERVLPLTFKKVTGAK
jgi:hypothetical protein